MAHTCGSGFGGIPAEQLKASMILYSIGKLPVGPEASKIDPVKLLKEIRAREEEDVLVEINQGSIDKERA